MRITWMLCSGSISLLLTFFFPLAHTVPGFTGGVTAIEALVLEDAEIGTTFGHLSVTDPDDPTYDGPDSSDISLQQSNDNLFSFTVTGTQVFLTVAVSLSGLAGLLMNTLSNIPHCKNTLQPYDVTVQFMAESVTVNIEVKQTNFPPTFYSSHYFATIPEDWEVGHVIIASIEAVDFDQGTNGDFEYLFDPQTTSPAALSIDPTTGTITLAQSIDYDAGDTQFEVTILAQETHTPNRLSDTATLLITVLNINDNPPILPDPAIYEYTITENTDPGLQTTSNDLISVITAVDDDAGTFGEVVYELTGAGAGVLFAVREITGGGVQLETLMSLDREVAKTYSLTLIARNDASPPLADTVELQITVTDVNDLPPVFSVEEYHISLSETQDHNNFVTFHATDGDAEAPNNQVTYPTISRVDTPGGDNPFTIDSNTGTVSVTASNLDYETTAAYILNITARDGGSPFNEAEATLYITIVSVNEHPPMFAETVYTATVNENIDVDHSIGVTVEATDDLEGHTIEYSIDNTFQDGDFFNINRTTGAITLARPLDRDPPLGHETFTFIVVATDIPPEGESQVRLTAEAQVVVTVRDVNDNAPIISSPDGNPIILEILEGFATLGIDLFSVTATDIDAESDGDSITYSLTATDDSLSFFSLGEDSGVFQQRAQLDREACNPVPCHYEMEVSACDQGTTAMCTSVGVTVIVLDYNDNPPVLTNTVMTVTTEVAECELDGRVLSTVTAEDTVDTGDYAEVAYEVVQGDERHIILNQGTGQLFLGSEALDYETGPRTFSLTVRAIDNPDGTPQLPSNDSFVQTIEVGDCNDNPPMFSDLEYDFSVTENADPGPIAGPTITSSDADTTSVNQDVMYRATDLGSDSWFEISNDGVVSIRNGQTVDREAANILTDSQGNGVVTFHIEAVNVAPTGTLISPQTALVRITISDQNDNPPIMNAMPITGSETIRILETTPANTLLTVVQATDADVGDNADITYQITSGNELGKFEVDGETGAVTLVEEIDFESDSDERTFTITITAANDPATNPPSPTQASNIELVIIVEGTNEHAPVFTQDSYDETISEHNALRATQQHSEDDIIVNVLARDNDTDYNDGNHDDVQYYITAGDEEGIFDIPDPLVGNIVIKRPEMVDYEATTSYRLLVTATDLVFPVTERRSATTYVSIAVIDENDNVPQLSSDMYTGFVNEEEPSGTTVILTTPITASDADSLGGTETLQYDISTAGQPQPRPFLAFSLSQDGTTLTTTTEIDREVNGDIFTFQITVTDSGGNEDTALVNISIHDVNDNSPQIQETPEELFITIPENHPVGSTLAIITAVDIDQGTNADYIYVMEGGAGHFEIGIHSGVVQLVTSLQDLEPPKMFPLKVYARDTGGLNTTITFLVNLTYSNDHPPIFNPSIYFGSIPECVDDGSDINPVITIRATDADSNAVVTYYTESTDIGGLFRLDDRGGVADILTQGSGVYDRETAPTLRFAVFATDGTLGTSDDFANVTITVTDCNDNNPIFTQELYEVDVYEGTVRGSTVIQVHTNDADIDENKEVRYTVDSVDPPSLTSVFIVDPVSGGIVTNIDITNQYTGSSTCSSLTEQSNNISLVVKATDQATQQARLSNYTTVFIRLLDRNSHAPSFIPSNFYSFSVSENVEDIDIGRVEATDECDQNSVVTYVLVTGGDTSPFEINQATGLIHLTSSLDRETNDLLVIQLEAVDDGTDPGPQTGYASVSIMVLDENDNAPKLVDPLFELTRPENIPVGTTLITLTATDPDFEENGTLSYSITSGDTDLFMLEGSEGTNSDHLVTVAELDRETLVNHVVMVTVEDGGTTPKSDVAIMNLTLSDVNDNEPVWTAGHGTTFDIRENASSMEIVDLDAEDRDEGINSELVYFFVGGSQDLGPFHIDRNNGTLHLWGELDYESTTDYTLSIAVADRNGMANDLSVLRNTTTVTVNVVDINDNIPYFTRCPYTFEILESLSDGSVVGDEMVSSVEDRDSIDNQFYFYLDNEEDVECNEAFCIDEITGQITLNGNVDHETRQMYIFYVLVSDRPNLSPQEAYSSPTIDLCDTVATADNNITKVEVHVIDVNDHAPVFVADSLLAAVAEEAEFDTTVTVLRATDKDRNGTFSTVYYEIVAVDPPYLVDRETGEVTTADVFTDRSGDIDQYTVIAYDNEGRDPSFTSTAVLTVRVFKESQQVIAVVDMTKEEAETCRLRIEDAIANETGYIIYTTKIRVFQDEEAGIVDTTKADVIFYALDRSTGEVVEPQEVINTIERALDLQKDPIDSTFQDCNVLKVKPFSRTEINNVSDGSISLVIGIVIGILAAIIIALLICLLCVCALERRKARKLRMSKKQNLEHSSQFSQLSQFSQYGTSNPIFMPPYEQWEEESTTTAAQSTAMDRENPLYESQELTIEMFADDTDDMLSVTSSQGDLLKPPKLTSTPGGHDSVYDDHDPLADALGISGKPEDSQTSLI